MKNVLTWLEYVKMTEFKNQIKFIFSFSSYSHKQKNVKIKCSD